MNGDGAPQTIRFAKYHGTGNDFVMIEDLEDRLELTPALVAAMCDRHLGVGADGVIRVAPAEEAAFFMDYRNADGDVAEMCGNGIRCLAKYVYDRGLTSERTLDVATRAGTKQLALTTGEDGVETVRVDMGRPSLDRGEIPMAGPPSERFIGQRFAEAGPEFVATAVSMGNPHLVLVTEGEIAELDLPRIGPPLEHHPDFPKGTNVEFVRIHDGRIDVRVWERGSGETMACGTGGCASLVAASLLDLVGRRATVRFPGGDLDVEWTEDDRVFLGGPATFVFDGQLEPSWLASVPGTVAIPTGPKREAFR
jgi:diaminopimelate epimerase